MEAPEGFCRESFYGFDITDEQVKPSPYREIAIEVKHLFESIANDAGEKNEEVFLPIALDAGLRAFVRRPSNFTLCALLSTAPHLYEPVREITMLVSPSLLDDLPVVVP